VVIRRFLMGDQIPENLRYTEEHEWARLEGDTIVMGITDFAQEQLGDIVYVELPDIGEDFDRGETIGEVESVKARSDLYTPVAGEVTEVNEDLMDDPAVVNQDPYGEGWMVRVQLSDTSEWDGLLDAAAYAKVVEEEEAH
jgi:glycine cleavage system H protein